ncbi:ataxin-10 [Lasius niger]|uniref:Ataxin-10 n=1 Tax=Lasius niger TaxID=67767 RepID=A0A0J7JVW0_LASNI|nr:ataxin-10 [Lasius niger]
MYLPGRAQAIASSGSDEKPCRPAPTLRLSAYLGCWAVSSDILSTENVTSHKGQVGSGSATSAVPRARSSVSIIVDERIASSDTCKGHVKDANSDAV